MIFEEIRVEFVYFHKNRWSWKIEIFHYPLPSNEIIPPIHFCQSSPNFFPNWPGSCFKNSLEERHQFSFDLISGEEIIGCIPPRIFYSRRGREKKGGFKVARVAISAMPDQGGVVIRLGEGDGGRGWDTFRGRSISPAVKAPPWAATQSNFQVGSNCILILDRSTVLSSRFVSFSFFYIFYLQWRLGTVGGASNWD